MFSLHLDLPDHIPIACFVIFMALNTSDPIRSVRPRKIRLKRRLGVGRRPALAGIAFGLSVARPQSAKKNAMDIQPRRGGGVGSISMTSTSYRAGGNRIAGPGFAHAWALPTGAPTHPAAASCSASHRRAAFPLPLLRQVRLRPVAVSIGPRDLRPPRRAMAMKTRGRRAEHAAPSFAT